MPDLDPLAIGFVALWMLSGIVAVLWFTHGMELHGIDWIYCIGIVCFWPLVLTYLLIDFLIVKTRERLRI